MEHYLKCTDHRLLGKPKAFPSHLVDIHLRPFRAGKVLSHAPCPWIIRSLVPLSRHFIAFTPITVTTSNRTVGWIALTTLRLRDDMVDLSEDPVHRCVSISLGRSRFIFW